METNASAAQGGVTLRACKNALARFKLQLIFRLFFLAVGLVPLLAAISAWRFWLLAVALVILDIPALILTLWPDICFGVLNTDRAYACINYSGFFRENAVDRFLQRPYTRKKYVAVCIVLLLIGWARNIRDIVRLCADSIDITRCLPRPTQRNTRVLFRRFCRSIWLPISIFFLWCCLAGTLAGMLSDVASRAHSDPYRFYNGIDDTREQAVMQAVSQTMRQEDYFYYVRIPFNENGFVAQNAAGTQQGEYLACISHHTGTQESWEIVLTLTDTRSSAWKDDAQIIHPIRFDAQAESETIYISGSDKKTLHYRDESGTYVHVAQDQAPAGYQALVRYIILDEATLSAMQQDSEHLAADSDSGFIHIRYETEDMRITIGVKEDRFPYEVAVSQQAPDAFCFETEAILFDGTHTFTLPQ